MKRQYTIIIDQKDGAISAIAPDAVAVGVGDTLDEVRQSVREGIEAIIESSLEDGQPIPEARISLWQAQHDYPNSIVETIKVDVPDAEPRWIGAARA